jgi:hypothetical protein
MRPSAAFYLLQVVQAVLRKLAFSRLIHPDHCGWIGSTAAFLSGKWY